MKLFDFNRAPNPRRVRIFIAEKGISVPTVTVNLYAKEQLSPEFLAINPAGTLPLLETDDGTYLSETIAICHYLESLHPEPPLLGRTPLEQAQILMWNNIVEQTGFFAVAETLRNWSPGFRGHVFPGPVSYPQMPELIERGRKRTAAFFDRMEQRLAESAYLAGTDYSLADISLLTVTEFAAWVKIDPTENRPALTQWYALVSQRPTADA